MTASRRVFTHPTERDPERKRRELIDWWLPEIVDDVLDDPEIAEGVARAGLDREHLRQQALTADEVLAPAEPALKRAVEAAVVVPGGTREVREDPVFGIVGMTLGVALIIGAPLAVIAFWLDLPWWGAVLAIGGTIIAVPAGILIVIGGRYIYQGIQPPSVTQARTRLNHWRLVCRDDGVLPFVRRVINEHFDPIARTSMTVSDAPGLRGVSESSYAVRTSSVHAFLAAARRMPSGAIGIAGPRGVGKTSLIEYFAGLEDDHGPLKVTVAAPVQYEPRDFVLHLFATVCKAVVRDRRTTVIRFPPPRRLRKLFLLATGIVVAGALTVWLDVSSTPVLWAVPAAVLALSIVLGGVHRPRRDDGGVATLARQHLQNIHYLQTHTTGWSGKLTLPLSSEAGWSRTAQRERRAQTYPELVATLCEFLAAYAAEKGGSPAMIIAVDELDKIGSADRAQQFVNEIKSIFGASGTQFLVSVSEDALASFERRGMPVRDAFDSAFHEIVRVDYLTLADTAQLVSSRVIGLPEPFTWLVHCMSGGLPRDVVRTARAMVALAEQPPPSLDDVCAVLVDDDLRRKSHAFQLACRDLGDDPEVTTFIRTLRRLPAGAAQLLALVPELRMGELGRQAAAYVYYSATLREVFTRDRVDARDAATFDSLARAKQSLAVHPRLAWLLVDEFREAWGLPTVPAD
jgi:hypothetical protein